MTTSVFTRPSCFAIVAGPTTVSGFGAGVTGARSSPVQAQCERPDAPGLATRTERTIIGAHDQFPHSTTMGGARLGVYERVRQAPQNQTKHGPDRCLPVPPDRMRRTLSPGRAAPQPARALRFVLCANKKAPARSRGLGPMRYRSVRPT